MELTARTLSELLRALRSSAPEGGEKRTQPRVGLRARAQIVRASAPGRQVSVWVRDLSAGGIHFTCDQPFERGEEFKILLDGGSGEDEMVACTVRHCRKLAAAVYGVGAKFLDYELPEDQD